MLKQILETIRALLVWAGRLPETVATARKERQRRDVLAEGEAERLDRIRNPSKYRCK
jgi:hypothetical protein